MKERVRTYSKIMMKVITEVQKTVWYAHRCSFTHLTVISPAVTKKRTMFEKGPANAIAAAVDHRPALKRTP